ncbi:MAG TPA: CPXCG motif-containing cysteine-rich protein [Gammaproteobacteria bacterium]
MRLPVESISCPYCGKTIEIEIDDSVERQQYIEDCSVCCRPINLDVAVDTGGTIQLRCWTDSET